MWTLAVQMNLFTYGLYIHAVIVEAIQFQELVHDFQAYFPRTFQNLKL